MKTVLSTEEDIFYNNNVLYLNILLQMNLRTGRGDGVKKILEVGVSEAWGFFCDQPIT